MFFNMFPYFSGGKGALMRVRRAKKNASEDAYETASVIKHALLRSRMV